MGHLNENIKKEINGFGFFFFFFLSLLFTENLLKCTVQNGKRQIIQNINNEMDRMGRRNLTNYINNKSIRRKLIKSRTFMLNE